jgi:4-hydroxy-2-oxoheptanedioate aldolase
MAQLPRLNNVIRVLESGQVPIVTFAPPSIESATALSTSPYDAVVYEMEHNPYDITDLRHCLQYMLNRRQILQRATPAPAVTPMVRIPVNGADMNQWQAKQVLDIGVYGAYEPEGQRGDQPAHAARYWGLTPQEYYAKADVWPLVPHGEIVVIMMCEQVQAIDNLPSILTEVKGIGVVLIGEGDLSQNLGYPRQYEHPAVIEAMTAIRRICGEHNVVCGHPHVDAANAQRVVSEGYRFLMTSPERTFAGLEACRTLTGRT